MRAVQREFEVTLPVGYADEAGRVHRQAVIRKITGHEEALLYDPSLSAGRLVTELIHSCLLQLGSIPEITRELVSQLYTADRNYLLFELRRITLGDQLRAKYVCPHCGKTIITLEDLGQVEVRWLDGDFPPEDIILELDDGYWDQRNKIQQTEIVMTLPRGTDEEDIALMIDKDPLKAQDALLLRCIKKFGTLDRKPLEAFGVKVVRDLTLGDRQRINKTLNEHTPGVSFQRTLECDGCGAVFESIMDMTHFFELS